MIYIYIYTYIYNITYKIYETKNLETFISSFFQDNFRANVARFIFSAPYVHYAFELKISSCFELFLCENAISE